MSKQLTRSNILAEKCLLDLRSWFFEMEIFLSFMKPSAITLSNFDSFSVVSSTLHSAQLWSQGPAWERDCCAFLRARCLVRPETTEMRRKNNRIKFLKMQWSEFRSDGHLKKSLCLENLKTEANVRRKNYVRRSLGAKKSRTNVGTIAS